ncbi:MAG: N-acetyl-gamma-glutamyl-phosphate reductase [Clostridia bacterium]|nr:N-acetyl-gamma-glutamyl-phosphate reductase [Clostridia bacterium]
MTKVFIDGSAGTTGLRIYDRLTLRKDISLLTLPDELRKNNEAKAEMLNKADVAFLCLPDAAAKESVTLVTNSNTVIIDTSTAHRTDAGWTYGFPELVGYDKIKNSKRIANPGCHASGFVALVKPLVDAGIINTVTQLTCFSLTGYSGGGKGMIAEYESQDVNPLYKAPRQYGLSQQHKHLKEMSAVTGLEFAPAFCPIVAPFYSGMEVTVPLFKNQLNGGIEQIKDIYKNTYRNGLVTFSDNMHEDGFISACALSGKDDMQISVFGNEDRIILVSRFDNLGKGASGAAIQNMNIVIGADETEGLSI